MEFFAPALSDLAKEAVRDGKREPLVVPLFLVAGAHLAEDIPARVTEAKRRYPQLQIEPLPPIGGHPRVTALFAEIVCGYASA